jgi:hypothetical protein
MKRRVTTAVALHQLDAPLREGGFVGQKAPTLTITAQGHHRFVLEEQ